MSRANDLQILWDESQRCTLGLSTYDHSGDLIVSSFHEAFCVALPNRLASTLGDASMFRLALVPHGIHETTREVQSTKFSSNS